MGHRLTIRPGRKRRLGCAIAAAQAAILLAAAGAPAATKTGIAADPVGDGPTPGRDITGVRVHWDSAGSMAVTVGFAGPMTAADRAQVTANARAANGRQCLTDSQDTYLLLSAFTGPTTGDDRGFAVGSPGWLSLDVQRVRGDDARTVTVFLDDERVGAYDLGCVDVRLSADGAQLDGVPPVFFGDGIDTDGDHVADSVDNCPTTPAATADGCPGTTTSGLSPLPHERFPPPNGPVTISSRRCVVPEVRGTTLAGAGRRLARRGCRVGRVVRVRQRRGSGQWRVSRQLVKAGSRRLVGTRVGLVLAWRRPSR